MFFKRDVQAALGAASSSRSEEPKRPRPPLDPPPGAGGCQRIVLTNEQVQNTKSMFLPNICDAIVVCVGETAAETLLSTYKDDSKTIASLLDSMQGIYWVIGFHNAHPIYKQETTEGMPENPQLLIHWVDTPSHEEGWYCSSGLWTSKKEQDEVAMVAWLGKGDPLPEKVHVPFWSKKASGGVSIMPLHEYSKMIIAELKGKDMGKGGENDDDNDDGGGKGAKGKHKGKTNRAGWLPKMAKLVTAIWKERWSVVDRLSRKYYENSDVLKELVDKQME